jgi:hypothetical protein
MALDSRKNIRFRYNRTFATNTDYGVSKLFLSAVALSQLQSSSVPRVHIEEHGTQLLFGLSAMMQNNFILASVR